MATKKTKASDTAKSSVRKRSRLVGGDQQSTAAFPGSEQDTRRRLGTFTGAGEHARVGGRNGIVGQTTKRSRTDKKSK